MSGEMKTEWGPRKTIYFAAALTIGPVGSALSKFLTQPTTQRLIVVIALIAGISAGTFAALRCVARREGSGSTAE